MSGAMTDDSEARDSQVEVDMVFWCKIDNVRVVATVLNTLLNKKSEYQIAYVEITKFVFFSSTFFCVRCFLFLPQRTMNPTEWG